MAFALPDAHYQASFVAALREMRTLDPPGASPFAVGLVPEVLEQPTAFDRYVDDLLAQRFEETPRPTGYVPATTLWWVEGDGFVGRLAIRHRLTPALRLSGGHIGYDVRPSRRGRGVAGRMLREALPVAAGLGIDPALLTCDPANLPSRRVIEKNGGELFEEEPAKLRFWVPTALP
ncbi:MAG: GNAT family N-acetyltransferase [Hamadaea sp.]|nr:GNAT family N-acetyltransferase [Hamadaea sp.]